MVLSQGAFNIMIYYNIYYDCDDIIIPIIIFLKIVIFLWIMFLSIRLSTILFHA